MAILRSGKITKTCKKTITKSKTKILLMKYGIRECFVKLNRVEKDRIQISTKYNFRLRNKIETKPLIVANKKKEIACLMERNIWNDLTNGQYTLGPGVVVLAKMNKYKPWPARINTIYRVGDVLKCYVLFFGTFQIGSVLRSQCVSISDCDVYLSHTVAKIKQKYKWKLNYDKIAETVDSERSKQIVSLTQIQKFLLALRDIERLHKVPYELSITKSDTV